jgi:V8-like Glu-specific endopeptidase
MKATSIQAIVALSLTVVALSSSTNNASHLRKRQLHEKDFEEDARIVNGQDASPGQFPYFGRWGGCGASLISSDFMLSAAHCNIQEGDGPIRLGAYEYDGDGLQVTIKQRFRHPNNEDNGVVWDYLLLQLSEPVTSVTPVPLNSEASVPQDNDVLTVCGLGRLNYEPGDKPNRLQVVNVGAHSSDYCQSAYGSIDENIMFCAGDEVYDSCVGDSGGPIMTSSGEQVGVVSFGDGCAKEGKPGVYARISYVLPWIQETICANSADPPPYCFGEAQKIPEEEPPTPNPTANSTPSPTNASTSNPSQSPTQSPTLNPTLVPVPQTTAPTPATTPAPVSQALPTPGPTTTVKVTCGDSTLAFPVPSAPDIESCDWLADGLSGYGALCDIYDVAMACQETCGICDLLAKFKN